jgi:hypothetical protein
VHLGAIASLLVLAVGAAAIAFVLGRIEFGMRRRLKAAAVAVAAVLAVWLLGAVHRAYDWSEQRRQSLPPSVVAALRGIPDPIELEVWLDRDDGRRWQLERDALAKLVLARSDTAIRTPLDGAADRIAEYDSDYGRIVIRTGGIRETRSTSRKELVTLVLEAAGAPRPDWTYPDYPGYPFAAEGATRTLLLVLAYLVVPAVLALTGIVLTRSRRRT